MGRLKLGAGVIGAMKLQTANALEYARDRKQFATPVLRFPLIREKLAKMATAIYAIESMTYRTSGLIDAKLAGEDKSAADYEQKTIAAIEEFAIEASIMKVAGSEALGAVIDEAVQIHGGYGYIEEYPVERAYRDQRVNRIFEGTNEINRMLISGMLLKRAMKGQIPLLEFAQAVTDELANDALPQPQGNDELAHEARLTEHLKRLGVYALKVAVETFGPEIEQHQEVLAAVADIVTDAYALDSMISRTRQYASGGHPDPVRVALVKLYAWDARSRALDRARRAVCASAPADAVEAHLAQVEKLVPFAPSNPSELRETVLARMESEGGYPIVQP